MCDVLQPYDLCDGLQHRKRHHADLITDPNCHQHQSPQEAQDRFVLRFWPRFVQCKVLLQPLLTCANSPDPRRRPQPLLQLQQPQLLRLSLLVRRRRRRRPLGRKPASLLARSASRHRLQRRFHRPLLIPQHSIPQRFIPRRFSATENSRTSPAVKQTFNLG